jgi:hypothetical protein
MKLVYSVLALFALTQLAAAQGTSGGTGAIASIPSSVVRAGEQKTPVTQPGLFSILTNPTQPDVNLNSKQETTRRSESKVPPK